ncbi:hypothetical protein Y032_0144g2462 [Ancylostoma ceylanicum]|nr:hypothetical protein Y032_0144g2462 [Ancylostoma ceylanicum]
MMIAGAFAASFPTFPFVAFGLYDCLYVFDACYGSWIYGVGPCRAAYMTYLIALGCSALAANLAADIISLVVLLYRKKKLRMNKRKFWSDSQFVLQTMLIGTTTAFGGALRYTFGRFRYDSYWLTHLPKFCDILLIYASLASIGFVNTTVRKEIWRIIRCSTKKHSTVLINAATNTVIYTVRSAQRRQATERMKVHTKPVYNTVPV